MKQQQPGHIPLCPTSPFYVASHDDALFKASRRFSALHKSEEEMQKQFVHLLSLSEGPKLLLQQPTTFIFETQQATGSTTTSTIRISIFVVSDWQHAKPTYAMLAKWGHIWWLTWLPMDSFNWERLTFMIANKSGRIPASHNYKMDCVLLSVKTDCNWNPGVEPYMSKPRARICHSIQVA